MRIRCCRRMGGASRKHDKPLITETSPFSRSNNPMTVRSGVTNKRFERMDSCYKSDSLFRTDSFHPLGSPTISTFGAVVDSQPPSMPNANKMSSSNEALIETPPEVIFDDPTPLPSTFIESQPSNVTRLLRESVTPSAYGSSVSLVPGPSLSHSTDNLLSRQTIKPVYIIPPEVEIVDIRHTPQPTRKQSAPSEPNRSESPQPMRMQTSDSASRLNSFSSLGSTGSLFTARQSVSTLGESQPAQESKNRDMEAMLTESTRSMLSQHSDGRVRVPSPVTSSGRDSASDMSHRALPPTPIQATPTHILPLKRHRSPLLSAEALGQNETSLDTLLSDTRGKYGSWTLPSKRRGLLPQTPPPAAFQRIQSPLGTSPPVEATPPQRPPRILIDPTRVMEFATAVSKPVDQASNPAGDHVTSDRDHVTSGRDHVMSEAKSDPTLCTNCGREIVAEPFYICVLDQEATSEQANSTEDTTASCDEAAPAISEPINNQTESEQAGSTEDTTASCDEAAPAISEPINDESEGETPKEFATPPGSPTSTEEGLEPGAAICMNCISKDGPIYHELEPGEIEAILSNTPPPIPAREKPLERSPVYERISSVKRKLTLKLSTGSRVVTRVSLDGAYIIKASRPRRLRQRKQSSTDYEEGTPSPHYHTADELHSRQLPLPAELNPADHMTCKPHPPLLRVIKKKQSSTHDYESLPGSLDLGKRRGSHDYAFIGPAPSIESLDRCDSPLYAPPTGNRATLMRIDSQGYASVVIPDHPPNEEACQTSSCLFHSSTDALHTAASDYEVPVITRTAPMPAVLRKSITRQTAVSDLDQTTLSQIPRELAGEARAVSPDPRGSMESVSEQVSVTDEVFDSGFENSNECFEITSPPAGHRHKATPQLVTIATEHIRDRAVSKPTRGEGKLCILLREQSSVVV